MPHVTPAIAKAIVGEVGRSRTSSISTSCSREQKLTDQQFTEMHGKLFVPLDLNSAADEEILAIPGIGKRMLHEFKEYRPYKAMEQFRREIGKYIDKDKREAELATARTLRRSSSDGRDSGLRLAVRARVATSSSGRELVRPSDTVTVSRPQRPARIGSGQPPPRRD